MTTETLQNNPYYDAPKTTSEMSVSERFIRDRDIVKELRERTLNEDGKAALWQKRESLGILRKGHLEWTDYCNTLKNAGGYHSKLWQSDEITHADSLLKACQYLDQAVEKYGDTIPELVLYNAALYHGKLWESDKVVHAASLLKAANYYNQTIEKYEDDVPEKLLSDVRFYQNELKALNNSAKNLTE